MKPREISLADRLATIEQMFNNPIVCELFVCNGMIYLQSVRKQLPEAPVVDDSNDEKFKSVLPKVDVLDRPRYVG